MPTIIKCNRHFGQKFMVERKINMFKWFCLKCEEVVWMRHTCPTCGRKMEENK